MRTRALYNRVYVSTSIFLSSQGKWNLCLTIVRSKGLVHTNVDLETWISIGGWSMNDPDQPTATTFSDLPASGSPQSKFFDSLMSFMETYGFDGVDIDPVAEERSGRAADFDNYTSFLKNLRNALGSMGHKYGLIVEIGRTIDWFNLMSVL
jgi:chitinase